MPPRGGATRRAVGARVVGEILARSEAMKPPERPSGVRGFGVGPDTRQLGSLDPVDPPPARATDNPTSLAAWRVLAHHVGK